MATSAEQVLERAVQRSALNNRDLIPTSQSLEYMTQFERRIYLRAAKLNPSYFGTSALTAIRPGITDPWNMASSPGNVAALTDAIVESIVGTVANVSVGTEVRLIDRRWPSLEIAPRAYVLGRNIFQFGTELGTNVSNLVTRLTLFYSPIPVAITALAQPISLPDEFAELLVIPLARYFALRDRRLDELEALQIEEQIQTGIFDEAVGFFAHGAIRPLISVPAATPGDLAPPARGQ